MITLGDKKTFPYVVNSMLDTDFYKFTMGQVIWERHRDVPVAWVFKNRTLKVPLAEFIREGELRRELDHMLTLRFTRSEIAYLRGIKVYGKQMFHDGYLDFIENLMLPSYVLRRKGNTYEIEFRGTWAETTYWEIYALEIVNELYFRAQLERMTSLERDFTYATGILRLAEKIRILKTRPDITFCDFGTRRRFSREWQEYVVRTLVEELSPLQFLGTSNVYLAMKYNLTPMGTSAHEMFMAYSGIYHGSDDEIRASHNKVYDDWWDEYGFGLSVALTDTYGSDYVFQTMTAEQARKWKGFRQDSGDPFEFGEKAINFYEKHGIDSREKLIVFSDGLDIETIVSLADRFKGRIKVTFGWGTNLTNDLGLGALSLIVKLMESCGYGTGKLSDNLAKAMGNPEVIERLRKIFGYDGRYDKACVY